MSDDETVELMLRGLDQGLQSGVASMFNVLCSQSSGMDAAGALKRFSAGIANTEKAYADAKAVILAARG